MPTLLITSQRSGRAVTAAAVDCWAQHSSTFLDVSILWHLFLVPCGYGIPGISLKFQNEVRTLINSLDKSGNINQEKMVRLCRTDLNTWANTAEMLSCLPLLLSRPDDVTHRSRSVRLACLHQPPGAEDLAVQLASRPLRLPNPHPGWLGDPQRSERQALLLQPGHRGADLEATAHQGYEQQHQQYPRRQPVHSGEWGEGCWGCMDQYHECQSDVSKCPTNNPVLTKEFSGNRNQVVRACKWHF